MPAFNLQTCARPNILQLQPYRCARDDYKNDGINILLDANENAFGPSLPPAFQNGSQKGTTAPDHSSNIDFLGLNRYPDPHQHDLKELLCTLRNTHAHTSKALTPANLFVGVGSDEAIDALLRCFCVPGRDAILVCPPTYGMYTVSAQVNDISLVKIPLLPAPTFQLDVETILATLTKHTTDTTLPPIKLLYLCSPGNPTGSLLSKDSVARILAHPTWNGIVALDEAYIDFAHSETASLAEWVLEHPNLVVMQTLSKAFGLAGIRLGAAFCAAPVAALLNALKAPYNVSSPTSALACAGLQEQGGLRVMRENRSNIVEQRSRLLAEIPMIEGVGRLRGGVESNFLLYEMLDAQSGKPSNAVALKVYEQLAQEQGVVVRFRGKEHGCEGCLRITVGTSEDCMRLLEALARTLKEVRSGGLVKEGAEEARREAVASEVVT